MPAAGLERDRALRPQHQAQLGTCSLLAGARRRLESRDRRARLRTRSVLLGVNSTTRTRRCKPPAASSGMGLRRSAARTLAWCVQRGARTGRACGRCRAAQHHLVVACAGPVDHVMLQLPLPDASLLGAAAVIVCARARFCRARFCRAGGLRGRGGHRRPGQVHARPQGHGGCSAPAGAPPHGRRCAPAAVLLGWRLRQWSTSAAGGRGARLVPSPAPPRLQDKILQSMGRGQEVTVTNDGATILKSIYIDNPAAKVLVGEHLQRHRLGTPPQLLEGPRTAPGVGRRHEGSKPPSADGVPGPSGLSRLGERGRWRCWVGPPSRTAGRACGVRQGSQQTSPRGEALFCRMMMRACCRHQQGAGRRGGRRHHQRGGAGRRAAEGGGAAGQRKGAPHDHHRR